LTKNYAAQVPGSGIVAQWSNIVHNWNPFDRSSGEHDIIGRGRPLSEFEHQYFAPAPFADDWTSRATTDVKDVHGLRYSPPWPWVLAIALSLAMWTFVGWLVAVAIR
jgi:hypothetical protein